MSLVHCGVDTWVALALLGVDELALDAEGAVDETCAVAEAGEAGRVLDVPCAPDPEVALLHPASAAPTMTTNAVSCALLSMICVPLLGIDPVDFRSRHRTRRRAATREIQPVEKVHERLTPVQRPRSFHPGTVSFQLGAHRSTARARNRRGMSVGYWLRL
jgi:hypothetical protein